jgi:hypothetical protein
MSKERRSQQTISDLILELESFEDQGLEVLLSVDGGQTTRPISMIGNNVGRCLLCFHCFSWLKFLSPETKSPKTSIPRHLVRGKKIPLLLRELRTFEDMRRIVDISINDGDDCHPISRIEQRGEYCLLMHCPD